MEVKLDIFKAVSYGLGQVIGNLKYFAVLMGSVYASSFGLILIIAAIAFASFVFLGTFLSWLGIFIATGIPLTLLASLFIVGLYYGLLKNLMVYHDEACGCAPLSLLYSFFNPYIFSIIGCVILYWLAMAAGFMLLIIPGIFLWVRFMFATFYMVDRKMPVLQSLKKSYELTRGAFWKLFFLNIVAVFIFNLSGGFMHFIAFQYYFTPFIARHLFPSILGFLVTFLIAIITIPASQLMLIHAFRQLQKIKSE